MTIAEAHDRILYMLGEPDDTTDYDSSMYGYMDSIQREICTEIIPLRKSKSVTAVGGTYTIPADVYEITGFYDSDYKRVSYKRFDQETILIDAGTYTMTYNAYPAVITSASTSFDISIPAQDALLYGVCAMICTAEDDARYSEFQNKCINKLTNLSARPTITFDIPTNTFEV